MNCPNNLKSILLKFLCLGMLIFAAIPSSAQQVDFAKLDSLIHFKVDSLRQKLGLNALGGDATLRRAGEAHSKWMAARQELTHFETEPDRREPWQRVLLAGGTHPRVAENVLFNSLPTQAKLTDADLGRLAHEMFMGWYHSPGHYANMIGKDHQLVGHGFGIDPKTNKIYATQLFSGREFQFAVKTPVDAYGLRQRNDSACACVDKLRSWARNRSQYIFSSNDSLFVTFQDFETIKRTLSGKLDGLAIDIAVRSQFPLDSEPLLHGSPVHDGVLLPPVYLSKRKPNKRDLLFMGMVPAGMEDRKSYGLILIKDNFACSRSYGLGSMAAWYYAHWLPISHIFNNEKIQPFDLSQSSKDRIEFAKNSAALSHDARKKLDSLAAQLTGKILKLEVIAYASVEGPSTKNAQLHQNRAAAITSYLRAKTRKNFEVEQSSKVNWKAFYQDVKKTRHRDLAKMDSLQVLNYFEANPAVVEELESVLEKHRYAAIRVSWDPGQAPWKLTLEMLPLALKATIKQQDYPNAERILSKMIKDYKKAGLKISEETWDLVPLFKPFGALTYNRLVHECTDKYYWDWGDMALVVDKLKPQLSGIPEFDFAWAALSSLVAGRSDASITELEEHIENHRKKWKPSQADTLLFNTYLGGVWYNYKDYKGETYQRSFGHVRKFLESRAYDFEDTLRICHFYQYLYENEDVERMLVNAPNQDDPNLTFTLMENSLFTDSETIKAKLEDRMRIAYKSMPWRFWIYAEQYFEWYREPLVRELIQDFRKNFWNEEWDGGS